MLEWRMQYLYFWVSTFNYELTFVPLEASRSSLLPDYYSDRQMFLFFFKFS